MDVTEMLMATCSADSAARRAAEETILQAKAADFGGYLQALMAEAADDSKPAQARLMAAMLVKNALSVPDGRGGQEEERGVGWCGLSAEHRGSLKSQVLAMLAADSQQVRQCMALCVAYIARVELPANEWPELIMLLVGACAHHEPTFVASALTCLEYIAEECDSCDPLSEVMQHYTAGILSVICPAFTSTNPDVQFHAVSTMGPFVGLIAQHMGTEAERLQIVQSLAQLGGMLTAGEHTTAATRAKAMEALARLMAEYPEHMIAFAGELWPLTSSTVRMDEQEVGRQALVVWSAVCDADPGVRAETLSAMRQPLTELLCECLQKQEDEDEDDDEDTLSGTASLVLVKLAEALPLDDILMPFITTHIQNTANWRAQDAAVVALGVLLSNAESPTHKDVVQHAIPTLFGLVTAAEITPVVRDSALWALSVVADKASGQVLEPQVLQPLLEHVVPVLNAEPRLVARAANVLRPLFTYFEDTNEDSDDGDLCRTNELSPFYAVIATALVTAADRQDLSEKGTRLVQEAVDALPHAVAQDTVPVLAALLERFVARRNAAGLTNIMRTAGRQVAANSPAVVTGVIAAATEGEEADEALMCIGAVATALGAAFLPHVPEVQQTILAGLSATGEEDVCRVAAGAASEVVSSLKGQCPAAFVDAVVPALVRVMADASAVRDLKPPVLDCIGTIACVQRDGALFTPHVPAVLTVLQEAAGALSVGCVDDDDTEFVGALFEAIMECLTGILQGAKGGLAEHGVLPYAEWITTFIVESAARADHGGSTLAAYVGVVGDLADVLGQEPREVIAQMKPLLLQESVWQCVASAAKNNDTAGGSRWARSRLEALQAL